MKSIVSSGLVVAAMALTACSGSSDKGPAACSSAQIDLYNSITSNARFYSANKSDTYLFKIASDCASFKASMGSNSCVASNIASGKNVTVTYADLAPICDSDEVKAAASGKNQSSAQTDYKPKYTADRWDERPLVANQDSFSLKLYMPYSIESAMDKTEDKDTALLQGGNVVSDTDLDISKPYCTFKILSKTKYNKWSTWKMNVMSVGNVMGALDEGAEVAMSCTGQDKWTVFEINKILGIVAEVVPN